LNAAKLVVFEAAVSLAPSALLVSTVVGAGVGNAALESRRDRRAVAVAVGVRRSDGCRYFVADIVDVDVDDARGGDMCGVATVVELVYVVCVWDTQERERGERWIDLVGDLPRAVNVLALFGEILGPLGEGEEGRSTLLRRE
jgi:hypothetical protein